MQSPYSLTIGVNIVRARADVVATKLGIILSYVYFYFSFHILPNMRAAKGPERSGGIQPSDLIFSWALEGGVRALWVSEHPPRRMHMTIIITIVCYP